MNDLDELILTDQQKETIADLKIQAMLFGMDIDLETLSLVPKTRQEASTWLTRWKEKVAESDRPQTLGLEDVDYE